MGMTTLQCLGGPWHGQMRSTEGETLVRASLVHPWRDVVYVAGRVKTSRGPQHFWLLEGMSDADVLEHAERVIASAPHRDTGD